MAERAWAGLGGQSLSEGGPRLLLANQGLTNPNLINGQTNNSDKVDRMSADYMDKIPEKYASCLCVSYVGLLLIFPTFNGDMDMKMFLNYKKSSQQA